MSQEKDEEEYILNQSIFKNYNWGVSNEELFRQHLEALLSLYQTETNKYLYFSAESISGKRGSYWDWEYVGTKKILEYYVERGLLERASIVKNSTGSSSGLEVGYRILEKRLNQVEKIAKTLPATFESLQLKDVSKKESLSQA